MANGESLPCPQKDATEEYSTGILDWTLVDTSIRARRQVGRPKRRWEDDLNEFMKTAEGQEKDKYDLKNNNSWMDEIEDYKKWKENEEKFSKKLNFLSQAFCSKPSPQSRQLL